MENLTVRKIYFWVFLLLTITAFGFQTASAQFPIKVPKIPKVDKPKQEQPKQEPQKQESPNLDDIQLNQSQTTQSESRTGIPKA